MKTVKVLFTGPESSGKSTIGVWAAAHFKGSFVPEYARLHMQTLEAPCALDDLLFIANQQIKMEEVASHKGGHIFCDTSLLVIHIWMKEKFGVSLWDQGYDLSHLSKFDRIFLCKPDFPWVPDPLRENPLDRDRLFQLYERYLSESAIPYTLLTGPLPERKMKLKALL